MSDLKGAFESIEVHCYCPFSLGDDEQIMPLKELVKIAGYLTTAEQLSYVDEALQAKKESNHINDAQRKLLEQVHEEVKSLYGEVGVKINRQDKTDHAKVPEKVRYHRLAE